MPSVQKSSRLALALLATTMLTQPARAAPGDTLGPELQVNTHITSDQRDQAVAMDADGDFVVAWTSYGQDGSAWGVFAQRYNAAGVAQGPEFLVNTVTTASQRAPAVAMDADGDFVVAWASFGEDGDLYGVFAQRFDAAGVAQGSAFLVNTHTTSNQTAPTVAMDADGDFVVAWQSFGQDGSSWGVFAQRFDAAGVAQGSEFQVNTFTTNVQGDATVAMDADGDFVVAWNSNGQVAGFDVFAQRFDTTGAAQGSEVQVNTFTTGDQVFPSIAMDADGDFVVAWAGPDGSSDGVFAQRFDALGVTQGSEFQVNTFTTSNQWFSTVAMDTDGDFAVAWQSYGQDGSAWGVFAQRFDAAGATQGSEFQVNSFTTGDQVRPAVAVDADGDFVVAWHSDAQVAGYDVFAQRYDGVERIEGDFDGDGNEDLLWRNTTSGAAVVWLMDGASRLTVQTIGRPPGTWQVAGIGEFNGDDRADILWRNTATGANRVWQMDGFTIVDNVPIDSAPPVWVVEKVLDSDGDGLSDIFWRNSTTGATLLWRMRGFQKVAVGGTGGVPAAWQVQ